MQGIPQVNQGQQPINLPQTAPVEVVSSLTRTSRNPKVERLQKVMKTLMNKGQKSCA